ncbi:MAG: InlB B-repeat-containing protein, partial [Thermoanaerobaculia bacterium]
PGVGPGVVAVSWQQNFQAAARSGAVAIAGKTFSVTQSGTSAGNPAPHGFLEVTSASAQVHDLAVGPDGAVYVLYGTSNPKTLHVVKSTDGAVTWQSPVSIPNSSYTNSDFQLAVDAAGVLHVVWYVSSDDQVYYARSTNGGASFSTPVGVRTGNFYNGYRTDNGIEPAVAADGHGNVYVAYGAYTTNSSGTFLGYNVWVSRSTDSGSSFTPEFPITEISSAQKKPRRVRATASYLYVLFMDETNDDLYCHRRSVGATTGTTGRVNATPGAVQYGGDFAVGPNDAILYATFSDTTSDAEGNIPFTKSTDGGRSWSAGVRVNDSTNRQQYHPGIGIDSAGRIHMAWTDGRSNGRAQAYYAVSYDNGVSFSPNVNVSAPMTDVRFTQTHLAVDNTSAAVYVSATRDISQVMVARRSVVPVSFRVLGAGTGSGSVTAPGIDCTITKGVTSGTCSGAYPHDVVLTVRATAASGSSFTQWSGGCGGTGACTLTLIGDHTVTASFSTTTTYTLTVTGSGTGQGSITGNGIACIINGGATSGTCTQTYAPGTSVTLNATPLAGATFTGWADACTGTGTCPITMTGNKYATASFARSTTGRSLYLISGCRLLDSRNASGPWGGQRLRATPCAPSR